MAATPYALVSHSKGLPGGSDPRHYPAQMPEVDTAAEVAEVTAAAASTLASGGGGGGSSSESDEDTDWDDDEGRDGAAEPAPTCKFFASGKGCRSRRLHRQSAAIIFHFDWCY